MPTLAEEFAAFWAVYPRRVSRQDAEKAYQKARIVATADEILAGVRAFAAVIEGEQRSPDERRFIPYAATWLNKGRWTDEYETPAPVPVKAECTHTPRCHNAAWCAVVRARERGEVA